MSGGRFKVVLDDSQVDFDHHAPAGSDHRLVLLQGNPEALSSRLTAYLLLPAQTYSEGRFSYTPAYCYPRVALFLPSPNRLQLLLLAPCLPGECTDPNDPPETFEPL